MLSVFISDIHERYAHENKHFTYNTTKTYICKLIIGTLAYYVIGTLFTPEIGFILLPKVNYHTLISSKNIKLPSILPEQFTGQSPPLFNSIFKNRVFTFVNLISGRTIFQEEILVVGNCDSANNL